MVEFSRTFFSSYINKRVTFRIMHLSFYKNHIMVRIFAANFSYIDNFEVTQVSFHKNHIRHDIHQLQNLIKCIRKKQ